MIVCVLCVSRCTIREKSQILMLDMSLIDTVVGQDCLTDSIIYESGHGTVAGDVHCIDIVYPPAPDHFRKSL